MIIRAWLRNIEIYELLEWCAMAKLIFIDENFSGRVYELMLEKTTVGRGDQNTLVIRDTSLSSTHCEILMHGSEVIVRDLDSRNGTFVEGIRLNKQGQIKSGQKVRFGSVEARLELDAARDDSATEITAIYTLGKIMRDQRKAEKQPKPGNPSMQLEPDVQPRAEEQTILIPRAAVSPPPGPFLSAQPEQPAKSNSIGKLALIAGLVLLGLVALIWLIWFRK